VRSGFIQKHIQDVVVKSTLIGTIVAGMNTVFSTANCPLKLKVCHPICYWHKKGNCTFPLEGYDERGRPVRKKIAPGINPASRAACLLASVRVQTRVKQDLSKTNQYGRALGR
jgi:hypothetical protein